MKSPLPSSCVRFVVNGCVVGHAVRTKISGVSCLLTAAHVLTTLRASDGAMIQNSRGLGLPLPRDLKMVFKSTVDVAGIEFPDNYASVLGVTCMSRTSAPPVGSPIRVFSWITGESVFTNGVVSGFMSVFKVKHTCSTIAGSSGSPLLSNGKMFALHVEGEGTHNVAVPLDFLGGMESDSKERPLREAFESGPDWEDAQWNFQGAVMRTRFRGREFLNEVADTSTMRTFVGFNGISWADDFSDDDMDAGDYDIDPMPFDIDTRGKESCSPPVRESSDFHREAATPPQAVTSSDNTSSVPPPPNPNPKSVALGIQASDSSKSESSPSPPVAEPARKRRSRKTKRKPSPTKVGSNGPLSPPSVSAPPSVSTPQGTTAPPPRMPQLSPRQLSFLFAQANTPVPPSLLVSPETQSSSGSIRVD
jgi:hypothetical protein